MAREWGAVTRSTSAARLKELFYYNPSTGLFTRLTTRGGQRAGSIAGSIDADGYRKIVVDGVLHRASHLAWLYVNGEYVKMIDHWDRNRANDRIKNLRPSTKGQNNVNSIKPVNNKSGFKGVSWHARASKWQAIISVNNKSIYLGLFAKRTDASNAYLAAARYHFGEFAHAG